MVTRGRAVEQRFGERADGEGCARCPGIAGRAFKALMCAHLPSRTLLHLLTSEIGTLRKVGRRAIAGPQLGVNRKLAPTGVLPSSAIAEASPAAAQNAQARMIDDAS